MSQVWDLESPAVSNKDIKLTRLVHKIFGDKLPHINENVTKAMSLYTYLAKRIDEPAEKLAAEIRNEGLPIFSEKDIREMQAILKNHKQNYAQFFKNIVLETQKGGAPSATPATSKPTNPLDADPSRSKFFDKLIRKIMNPLTSRIPPAFDGVLWYTFLIYNLEQMEFIGPFISTAFDSITLSLPVIAEFAGTGFETLISLAPVPYASFAGGIVGHIISLIFILFAIFLNMSRKHFGSAFKVSLEAIPMFGDILMDAAQNLEIGAERYLRNRDKMLKPIEKISPTLYDNLDYYVPDTAIHSTAPPPLSYDTLKTDVAGYVLKETGAADAIAGATDKIPSITGPNKVEAGNNDAGKNAAKNAAKNDAPKNDAPKNAAKNDAPKNAAKNDAPKNAAKNDAPKNDAPKNDAPKNDAPKNAAKNDAPKNAAKNAAKNDTPKNAAKNDAKNVPKKEDAKSNAKNGNSKNDNAKNTTKKATTPSGKKNITVKKSANKSPPPKVGGAKITHRTMRRIKEGRHRYTRRR
jgi:hypothetical protein